MSEFESTFVSVYQAIKDMRWWERFEHFEYSNEVLVLLGALLLIIGVIKIARSGFKMLVWVILCGVGVASMTYGSNNNKVDLPFNESNELSEYVGAGKELSSEMLDLLCSKREEEGGESLY